MKFFQNKNSMLNQECHERIFRFYFTTVKIKYKYRENKNENKEYTTISYYGLFLLETKRMFAMKCLQCSYITYVIIFFELQNLRGLKLLVINDQ